MRAYKMDARQFIGGRRSHLLVGESRKRWIAMFGDEEDKKDGKVI